jgi:hypothetical protein
VSPEGLRGFHHYLIDRTKEFKFGSNLHFEEPCTIQQEQAVGFAFINSLMWEI